MYTRRTVGGCRFLPHDLDISGIIDHDLYDLQGSAHVAGWEPNKTCHGSIEHMFPGVDLYCADPAQPLTTAGEKTSLLDHDLSDLSDLSDA